MEYVCRLLFALAFGINDSRLLSQAYGTRGRQATRKRATADIAKTASSMFCEKMSSYPVIATFVRQIKNLEFHVLFVAISVCLAN